MSGSKDAALELFKENIFYLSKKYPTYEYFPEYIKERLEEYIKVLKDSTYFNDIEMKSSENKSKLSSLPDFVEQFCAKINDCIENYYLGKINLAYRNLSDGLTNIKWGKALFERTILKVEKNELSLYRIRKKEDYEFTKGDMFHIPFEKRHKVSPQRFSIIGNPSLYLGESVYVCWEELNQPDIKFIYASRFRNTQPIKLIDIIKTEDLIKKINNLGDDKSIEDAIYRFIFTYPLTIACSVKTKNKNGVFKPEHIIPQLFLQFVIDNKKEIDGIKYFSTKIDYDRVENVGIYNYVFPARTNKKEGYCDVLNDKFEFTEPLLTEYMEISKSNVTFMGIPERKDVKIELTKGRKLPYDWTTFRSIEVELGYENVELSKL